MTWLDHLSIKNKIVVIILSVTLTLLLIGFSYIITDNIETLRNEMRDSAQVIIGVIADNNIGAIEFRDSKAANESLKYTSRVAYVTNVVLLDEYGNDLARYDRDPEDPFTVKNVASYTSFFEHGFLHIHQAVYLNDRLYGSVYMRATTKFLDQKIREHIMSILILMILLILAAFILSYRLQNIISEPILKLASAAETISRTDDYSIRVERIGSDEIGRLYDGFNLMLDHINMGTMELRKINIALENEISERIRAEIELRFKAEELKKRNKELDKFAYVTSHDLKAPLRAISNLSSWIQEDLEPYIIGEIAENFGLMQGRVKRMEALIDGILQYSRADRFKEDKEEVHVNELLEDIMLDLSTREKFKIIIEDNLPTLFTEKVKLSQVFSNLISNAMKYHNKEHGLIIVGGNEHESMYEFYVKDNGPGISKEYHEKIFMIFQTLEARDKVESTGVGLSIVKKIVEDHGGHIQVDSEIGKGTKFIFTWEKSG